MERQISPLFQRFEHETNDEANFSFQSEETHEFFLLEGSREIEKYLPSLSIGHSYSLLSFGDWSLKELVMHIARIIGPCDVVSTTYGLGTRASKGIIRALDIGLFRSFSFLYDKKVREYKEEAHNVCASRFPVKITSIHAKITILKNEEWGVMVTGSANWSDNNAKIEHAEVIVNREKADFFYEILKKSIECKAILPSEIKKELCTTNTRPKSSNV